MIEMDALANQRNKDFVKAFQDGDINKFFSLVEFIDKDKKLFWDQFKEIKVENLSKEMINVFFDNKEDRLNLLRIDMVDWTSLSSIKRINTNTKDFFSNDDNPKNIKVNDFSNK